MSDGFTMCVACYGINGEHEYSNCVYAPPPDPLATLRAEVERLRDEMHGAAMKAADVREIEVRSVGVHCYTQVLDLIDKQREGQ